MERGEGPVALVFGRHGHDRSRAVTHENVVSHVQRHRLIVEGVDHVGAGEGTPLVERSRVTLAHALDIGLDAGPAPQFLDHLALGVGGQFVEERMLRGDHGVGHAETGVRPRRENPELQFLPALDGQVELGALGTADPVALHHLDLLGPVEIVERFEELVGVRRDPEEPLLELAPLDQVA